MKTCTKCHRTKSFSEFRKDKQKKDGHSSRCKTCLQKDGKQFHTKNREKRNILNKERSSTPEYKKRKAKYDKAYRELQGEKRLQSKRDYYHNRGGKEIGDNWRKENKEKCSLYAQNMKHKRRELIQTSTLSPAMIEAWKESQLLVCSYCGVFCSDSYHIDHIEPLSMGGKHELDNFAISCPFCNISKSNTPLITWLAKRTNRSTG